MNQHKRTLLMQQQEQAPPRQDDEDEDDSQLAEADLQMHNESDDHMINSDDDGDYRPAH